MSPTDYRPELDGLRCVAVLPVLMYHFGMPCPGGFAGVDVFFVISGFLITRILIREAEQKQFSFFRFWERRIRRIVPLLFTVLAATLLLGWAYELPSYYVATASMVLCNLVMLANVKLSRQVGYWDVSAEDVSLLHTWSLSVEEQFYILVPLAIILVVKRSRIALLITLSSLLTVSLFLSVVLTASLPSFAFYNLPCRAWQLSCGAIVATCLPWISKAPALLAGPVATIGLLAITASYAILGPSTAYPGAAALLPTIGAACVIAGASATSGTTGRILASVPCVLMGRISYGLYLWHWPVAYFGGLVLYPSWSTRWIMMAVTAIIASGTYVLIEQPCRRREIVPTQWLMTAVLVAGAMLAAASFSIRWKGGMVDRLPKDFAPYYAEMTDESIQRFDAIPAIERGGVRLPRTPSEEVPRVVVVGSSHAMVYGHVIEELARKHDISIALLSSVGTHGTFDIDGYPFRPGRFASAADKLRFDKQRAEWLNRWRPNVVLWFDRWDTLADMSDDQVRDTLTNSLTLLKRCSNHVVVFGQPPCLTDGLTTSLQNELWKTYLRTNSVDQASEMKESGPTTLRRRHIESIVSEQCQLHSVTFISVESLFERDGLVSVIGAGRVLYRDGDHLSNAGAETLKTTIEQIVVGYLRDASDVAGYAPLNDVQHAMQ